MSACSIRTIDEQKCLSWKGNAGAQVIDGQSLYGPYSCYQLVSRLEMKYELERSDADALFQVNFVLAH
jgi:hypothetical protein